MALILASGSPRRRELMALITPDYTVITSDVDEGKIAADTPAHLAQSLASAKARAVAKLHPADTVLGFDTVVDCGGEVFGKPQDEADALRMLRALSGRTHKVHTGVCICKGGRAAATVETTLVHFSPIVEDDLRAYVRTPEPQIICSGVRRTDYKVRLLLMPSRGMLPSGARASRCAITTLWGCRSTARHSFCANLRNICQQPRQRKWELHGQIQRHSDCIFQENTGYVYQGYRH